MQLSDLLSYDQIVVQCHDTPDADTISSGYGIYLYLKHHKKDVRLVYSGKNLVVKSSLKLMISELKIPLEYIHVLDQTAQLLITVDCQYGEGNVTKLEAKNIAVIDHHYDCHHFVHYKEIRSTYGSCATIVYAMLLEDGFAVNENKELMTALYYGLYMDTNAFSEIRHPYDMDMLEDLKPNEELIMKLKNSNFTFDELEIAANALIRYNFSEAMRYAVVRANSCDPNLLGFISDLVLQVDDVDTSIAFCELDYEYKISVRNCNTETTSVEIIHYLVKDMGAGGGHKNKAGGYIVKSIFKELYQDTSMLAYLLNSLREYFVSYDIIYMDNHTIDINQMQLYERRPILYGVCKSTEIGAPGEWIKIRTMNQEIRVKVSENLYLLLGVQENVIPMEKELFEKNYRMLEDSYNCFVEYRPYVRIQNGIQTLRLTDYLKCCISTNKLRVYARKLEKTMKIYQNDDAKNYILGDVGDYLVVKTEEENDISIVKRELFSKYYTLIPNMDNNEEETVIDDSNTDPSNTDSSKVDHSNT